MQVSIWRGSGFWRCAENLSRSLISSSSAWGSMQHEHPWRDSKGVVNALELSLSYKTGRIKELSGTVVVVEGNTAIDAATRRAAWS